METKPSPLLEARIYDKHAPEEEREVAHLVADHGRRQVWFACQHTKDGACFLSKQHAVEFASAMLMMALGLPGDIPGGDVGHVDGPLFQAKDGK
jgi:hypothetical protein